MQITVWTDFVKKKNSMKKPSTSGTVVTCTLKGECSSVNPRFELGAPSFGLVNYVKWESMYYFVRNVTFGINNYVILECEIDVLATWKEEILSNTAFVSYSSSNYDTNIVDKRIVSNVNITKTSATSKSPFSNNCIILTTISKDDGVASYAIQTDDFYNLLSTLLSDESAIQDLKEMFGGVNNALISAIQVPVTTSIFPDGYRTDVKIGAYEGYTPPGWRTRGYISSYSTIEIPWGYSDFRRCREYTNISLLLPFIGTVEIDPDSIMGSDSLEIRMVACAVTGSISYKVNADDKTIGIYTGTFGRSIPIASAQVDIQGAMNGLTQVASGITNATIGAVSGNVSGIIRGSSAMLIGAANTAVALNTHNFSCVGGMGGNYGENLITSYEVIVSSRSTVTNPSSITATNGRPCFKELALNTLSGYVETIGFSFETNAVAEVRDKINEFMDTGVYIE